MSVLCAELKAERLSHATKVPRLEHGDLANRSERGHLPPGCCFPLGHISPAGLLLSLQKLRANWQQEQWFKVIFSETVCGVLPGGGYPGDTGQRAGLSLSLPHQLFSDVAYKARNREDLIAGIDEFLDEVIVLPPGEWDPNIRIEPPKKVPSADKR